MDNSLYFKPDYTAHRRGLTAADTTDLVALLAASTKAPINADGFDTIHGFVNVGGTVSPSVTLQLLEAVTYIDVNGVEQTQYVIRGSNIGPLLDGATFSFATEGGGRWFLRVNAVAGTLPVIDIYLAGGSRANEGSI